MSENTVPESGPSNCSSGHTHEHSCNSQGDSKLEVVLQQGTCCGGSGCQQGACSNSNPAELGEDAVRLQLKQVIDPELFVNIVDLGLVYTVTINPSTEVEGKQDVHVEMTLTSPMCPAGPQLVAGSRQVIESMQGVGAVDIKIVMDPPWSPDRMSEDARDQLNIF